MATINVLYDRLITRNTALIGHWASVYLGYTNEMDLIMNRLAANPSLRVDDPSLFVGTSTLNYQSFLERWLYNKNNGVSSTGQSLLSKANFHTLCRSTPFKALVKAMLVSPDNTSYVNLAVGWHRTISRNNHVRTNRAVATCNPKEIASTVDQGKFWAVLAYLTKNCGYSVSNYSANWFELNQELTTWLDNNLKAEKATYRNLNEYYIHRNIFVWMLYENDPLTPADKKVFY